MSTTAKLLISITFNLTIATLLALSVFVPGCAFLFPTVAGVIIGLHFIEIAILALCSSPCGVLLCLPYSCCKLLCGELSFDDFLNLIIDSVRVGSVIGLGLLLVFNVTLPITIPTLAIIYIASSAAFILKDMVNIIYNLTVSNTKYQSTNSDMNLHDTDFNNMSCCSFSRTNDRQFFSSSRPFFKAIGYRNNSTDSHSGNALNNYLKYR